MVLKRMRSTTNAAKERLQELHEQHRELEEHMLAVFSEVLDHTIETPTEAGIFSRGFIVLLSRGFPVITGFELPQGYHLV